MLVVGGKVKPTWIFLKQKTASGSGISWAIYKSAPRSRQITMPAPTTQFFTRRMPFLPPNRQRQSTEDNNNTIISVIHQADIELNLLSYFYTTKNELLTSTVTDQQSSSGRTFGFGYQ